MTWVGERRRDPVWWTEVIQLLKTVVAAVIAWVLAASVFRLQQPFLAPWSALLVVHATVYRTFSRGAKQVSAAVAGVLLAWAVGNTLGLDTLAVSVAIFVGLALGTTRWFAEETTTIAATAVVVLATGFSDDDNMLLTRLVDTGIGIGVGLVVNALVWPPLRRRTAVRAMDRIDDEIGALLVDIAEQLRKGSTGDNVEEWVERTRDIDGAIEDAWAVVRQARESARMNPRRQAAPIRQGSEWNDILERMEQAVAEVRSMARTLGYSIIDVHEWDDHFRTRWTGLVYDAGMAIADADEEGITRVRFDLTELAGELSEVDDLSARHWPEYGGLIINLRNISTSMDQVAAANPLTPSLPPTMLGTR